VLEIIDRVFIRSAKVLEPRTTSSEVGVRCGAAGPHTRKKIRERDRKCDPIRARREHQRICTVADRSISDSPSPSDDAAAAFERRDEWLRSFREVFRNCDEIDLDRAGTESRDLQSAAAKSLPCDGESRLRPSLARRVQIGDRDDNSFDACDGHNSNYRAARAMRKPARIAHRGARFVQPRLRRERTGGLSGLR